LYIGKPEDTFALQRLEGKESGDCDPIAADSMGSRREREGGREGGRGSLIGSSEPRWK